METKTAAAEMDSGKAAALVGELRENFMAGRTRSYEWRVAQLKAIARMIDEREAEIIEALYDDLAKPEIEAFCHEISLAKAACTYALKKLRGWMKPEKVSSSIEAFPSSAKIVSEPLGVVLIISAWNYPFMLALDPVIGAIAAGNAVVLKPSEVAIVTSSFFARVLPTYLDSSCIRVVETSIQGTSALLEQKWDKIFYTGNATVGRKVMAAAAEHLTPVVLELGGKSPVVVDSDVDVKVATKRIAVGKWGCNNGQACIAPDYIITTKSFAPKLVDSMKETLEEFYGRDPLLESTDLSRIVNDKHFKRLTTFMDDEKISEKIIYGGQRNESCLRIAPTLILDAPYDSLVMKEEIFGPLLPIVTVDNIEEALDFIRSRPKPLAAYLFTNDKKLEENFVMNISSGGMLINDTVIHMSNVNLPFGGVGESGMGSYHGKFSYDAFSHKKAVLIRSFAGEASIRYPPFTAQKKNLLRKLVSGDIIGFLLGIIRGSKN